MPLLSFTSPLTKDPSNGTPMYAAKWRDKGQPEQCIEIRTEINRTAVVAVVYAKPDVRSLRGTTLTSHLDVKLSANGTVHLTWDQLSELTAAIHEAKALMSEDGPKGD